MKILMLTPYVPYPPASGGQIRTLNLLKYLSKNNEITLIALYKFDETKKYSSFLKPYCKEIYLCKRPEKPWQLKTIWKAITSSDPFLIVRNYSEEAKKIVSTLLAKEKFDVIHAETFYIMPHIKETSTPIFLVEQTIEYKVYQHFVNSLPAFIRPFFMLDIVKLKKWEQYYWKKAFLVGGVSEADRTEIKKLEPSIEPVIIPNCAGDEMFVEQLERKNLEKPTILFIGNFDWLQNTEAVSILAGQIAPLIKRDLPNARIVVAGQNAKVKLARQAMPDNVEVIDLEQDDTNTVLQLYKSSTLFIAPIFGPGGTRLKILAAMASGLPVISSKTGVEGLNLQKNKHVLIAETPEQFAQQVKRILNDQSMYEAVRKEAYDLAVREYSWKHIAEKLEIVYKQIKKT
jgi:glycosyltransferase involved in cell wall biosynthesis